MRRYLFLPVVLCWITVVSTQARSTLDIYLIDVEGGNATLFVAPSGESLLIDTGNTGPAAVRDAGRIVAAIQDAGLTQIDHLITTHYHADHWGAMAEVASRIPIKHFIDHGQSVQTGGAVDAFLKDVYPRLQARGTHTVAKPGDRIAVRDLDVRVLTSGGDVIKRPLPGAGKPNPYCAAYSPQDPDSGENALSVGSYITFGRFKVLHLGDVTWNKEQDRKSVV